MKSNCTIIFTYLDDCSYRRNSFEYITQILYQLKINFIIVEQDRSKNKQDIEINKNDLYTHIKYYDTGLFKKSTLYNVGASHANTKYLWFLDCDIFMPYGRVIAKLQNQDVIRPFDSILLLSENDSNRLLKGKQIDHSKISRDNVYGKHSLIIKKDIFTEVDGFDERFIGWGWEDLDFVHNRLAKYDPDIFSDFNGYHFFHPRSATVNERHNFCLYKSNLGLRKLLTYSIPVFQETNLDLELLYNKIQELDGFSFSVEFSIVFESFDVFNQKADIIKKLKSLIRRGNIYFYYISSEEKAKKPDILNTLAYLSEGNLFALVDDINKINASISIESINRYNSHIIAKSFDSLTCWNFNGLNFFCKEYFDCTNGFNDSEKIDINNSVNFLKPVPKTRLECSTYGLRNSIFCYDHDSGTFSEL